MIFWISTSYALYASSPHPLYKDFEFVISFSFWKSLLIEYLQWNMHAPTQSITRDNLERSYTRAIFFNFSSIESSIATFKTNCIQHKKCRHYPWPGLFFFMILSEQCKRVDNSYWISDIEKNLITWFSQLYDRIIWGILFCKVHLLNE